MIYGLNSFNPLMTLTGTTPEGGNHYPSHFIEEESEAHRQALTWGHTATEG